MRLRQFIGSAHSSIGVVRATSRILLARCAVEIQTFRYPLLDFRDRVARYRVSPRSIDGPQIPDHEMRQAKPFSKLRNGCLYIVRQVGDKHVVTVEYQAVRPEKADGCPITIDAAEIGELGNAPPPPRLEHENPIGLITRDPEVVMFVDFQTVGPAADPVDEDFRP